MFFTSLVIGVLAGLGVPYVAGPLTEFTKNRFELNERETGIASFGAVLVVAGLIGGIIFGGFNAFWLVLGGLLGTFGMRLFALAKARTDDVMAARKSLADDAAKDAAEAAEDAVEDVVEDAKDVAEETAEKVVKKAKKTTKS
jgi:hypothetical protein